PEAVIARSTAAQVASERRTVTDRRSGAIAQPTDRPSTGCLPGSQAAAMMLTPDSMNETRLSLRQWSCFTVVDLSPPCRIADSIVTSRPVTTVLHARLGRQFQGVCEPFDRTAAGETVATTVRAAPADRIAAVARATA